MKQVYTSTAGRTRKSAGWLDRRSARFPAGLVASVLLAGGVALLAGQNEPAPQEEPNLALSKMSPEAKRWRDQVVGALDRIRNKVEEWGVVTISAPVAVLDETAFYVPYDIVLPEQAYNDARTDVEATAVQATERVRQNSADLVLTPTGVPGLAAPPAGGTSTTSTTSTVTAPADSTEPSPPPHTAAKALSSEQATKPFELLTGTPAPTKSVAAALREAQDNTMRQKIYSAMSHPQRIDGYNHVIFVIVQVSCNPGWRTQEHYIADCSASFEYYDFATKRHLSKAERRAPTVLSVLPLVDAQTVEMASSQRDVTQLALQVAASLPAKGVDIKGKDLFEFVKRYSRDLRSRTPIPVVNSYSSGGTFGFRFSPSFQAMRDPAQKESRAANVLLPTTFPALITVVVNDADYIEVKRTSTTPAILTHTLTRWYLKDRPPLWQFTKRLFTPMRRDTADMEIDLAQDVGIVYGAKTNFKNAMEQGYRGYFDPIHEEMRRQIIALEEKGIGRDWPIILPTDFHRWDDVANKQRNNNTELQMMEESKRKERAISAQPGSKVAPDGKATTSKIKAGRGEFRLDTGEMVAVYVAGENGERAQHGIPAARPSDTGPHANGGSIRMELKINPSSDGDAWSHALLGANGCVIATEAAAVQLCPRSPGSLGVESGRVAGEPVPVPAFDHRFGMVREGRIVTFAGVETPTAESPSNDLAPPRAGVRRASLRAVTTGLADEENPLLPPLPER